MISQSYDITKMDIISVDPEMTVRIMLQIEELGRRNTVYTIIKL